MKFSRRQLLAAGAAAVGGSGGQGASKTRIRLAVSTYSYWHFRGEPYPIERVIEDAARIGFDGVEILHRQMREETPAYLNQLKRLAFRNTVDLVMLSIHQNFISPSAEARQKAVEHTRRSIELAAALGIPCIRINSGRWGTIRSFDELMKVRGMEPPLPGYTDEDAFKWCIECIQACLPAAEKAGVILALENHWGLTTLTDNLLRIYRSIRSPWFGINLDTGNFPGDPYPEIEKLAPHAVIVQAKTYHGGGEWYTLDLDYKKIAGILRAAGYAGWVSLEMEGKEPPATAVPKSFAILREAFG